jgi:hypothetical protein
MLGRVWFFSYKKIEIYSFWFVESLCIVEPNTNQENLP